MHLEKIDKYTVNISERFSDIYLRFLKNDEYHQMLVIDDDILIGVIGINEIERTLKSSNNLDLCASDIMNTKFSYVVNCIDLRKKCFDIFYESNFDVIPIVEAETKKPLGLLHRKDFPEFDMISFSQFDEFSFSEDAILNYVLLDIQNLFYIDIGAFEPWKDNVTKWFSLSGRGNGINIEPQSVYFNRLKADRPNDICLQTALSDKEEELKLYGCSGTATARKDYSESAEYSIISATTLSRICREYIQDGQEIHILKIDVEGHEKQVLFGADFNNYRPWIIMIEATKPNTFEPTHDEWEFILLQNRYIFAKQYGINRFYVSEEHSILIDRFIDMKHIYKRLNIRHLKQESFQVLPLNT